MVYRVRLMPRAVEDIDQIYDHVTQAAPLRGSEWYERLIGALYSLNQSPERCLIAKPLSKPGKTIRKLLFGKRPHTYRIYFDIVEDTVRVLHVRHGARREPTHPELSTEA